MRLSGTWVLALAAFFIVSCQPTRRLGEGEILYTGAELKFEGKKLKDEKDKLLSISRPKANKRFLGLPIKLGIYNTFAGKEKGVGKWIREKFGEAPVTYQAGEVERSKLLMEKHLRDVGYLHARVKYDSVRQQKKAKVIYFVTPQERYHIREVHWPEDSTEIHRLMVNHREESELRPGDAYRLSNLESERLRLARIGVDTGFFGLNRENFYYHLDTSLKRTELDLYPRAAATSDQNSLHRHYFDNTTVYSTYLLNDDGAIEGTDTIMAGQTRFIRSESFVRPNVVRKAILQGRGDLYRFELQQRSVNRLLSLGPFKFVNLKYHRRQEGDSLFLDREFYLTPGLTQDFSVELEASSLTSSSNFLGSALHLNYTHRNFLGGAERFQLDFTTGVETQLDQDVSFVRNFNISVEARLGIPNLVVPFGLFHAEKAWQSRSIAMLGGDFQRRTGFFSVFSYRGQYGYEWQPGRLQRHSLYPLQLTQVRLVDATEEFRNTVDRNPRLKESYSDYFIAGATYQYNYSEQKPGVRENYFSLQTAAEPAGNLAYGISNIFKAPSEEPYELLGLPFAQFFRAEADSRYHRYNGPTDWIVRANLGVAYPYGNSRNIPFVRQFFVGGSNSMRAWHIRTLGPGTSDAGIRDTTIYNDQTGDIKLELNAEYRFPLVSYLHGAVFADAGNIWLLDEGTPEGEKGVFAWNNFLNEMAVGVGFGLRLDITYFVLRLDMAFPVRKPYLEGGPSWVFDEIQFGNPVWRNQNLVYNLALGYPF